LFDPRKGTTRTASEKSRAVGVTFRGPEKAQAIIGMTFGPYGPQNRYFSSKTAKREKRPDWLAEEPVTSELLSRREQGKIQSKLDTMGYSVVNVWLKPIHKPGVATNTPNERPSPNRE
jgi:hypothetical protein